jgi:hypothetical protein
MNGIFSTDEMFRGVAARQYADEGEDPAPARWGKIQGISTARKNSGFPDTNGDFIPKRAR